MPFLILDDGVKDKWDYYFRISQATAQRALPRPLTNFIIWYILEKLRLSEATGFWNLEPSVILLQRKKTGNRDEDLRRVHEKQKSVALHRLEEKLKNITGGSSTNWIKSLGEDIEVFFLQYNACFLS